MVYAGLLVVAVVKGELIIVVCVTSVLSDFHLGGWG